MSIRVLTGSFIWLALLEYLLRRCIGDSFTLIIYVNDILLIVLDLSKAALESNGREALCIIKQWDQEDSTFKTKKTRNTENHTRLLQILIHFKNTATELFHYMVYINPPKKYSMHAQFVFLMYGPPMVRDISYEHSIFHLSLLQ